MKRLIYILTFALLCYSCSSDLESPSPEPNPGGEQPPTQTIKYTPINAHSQRVGDAQIGYDYLINGNYMNSGIPYQAFLMGFGPEPSNVLNREGDNSVIPHDFTAIDADNGARVVAMNCLQCHSSTINGEFKIGLGNYKFDFTENRADQIAFASSAIALLYGTDSEEWEAFLPFKQSLDILGPATITETRGVNPADKTTFVLTAYRDKNTLEQLDAPAIEIPEEVLPSDVPAWWLLKKKNALFYHGIGRQDFCRSMITMVLATINNVEKAEEVDEKFKDILAFIYSIEPPSYPFSIDQSKVSQGQAIFNNNCATCHGTYEGTPSHPNKLIALETIGTDPHLSNFYTDNTPQATYFKDWFNTGWFGSGPYGLKVEAEGGYIAPPLDGIWATAPYFHNASVPTIYEVLKSEARPRFWRRTYESTDYNQTNVGWNYSLENSKVDKNTYDTTLKGYGNSGHTFGDHLTEDERLAVIEYLKTL